MMNLFAMLAADNPLEHVVDHPIILADGWYSSPTTWS